MDGKIQQCVCIKSYVKLGKSATETHEMLPEAFGELSLSRIAVFEWHSRFKASQGRWQTFRATKHRQNDRKFLKNTRTHQRRPSPNNPELADTVWISYGDFAMRF
jgi:hypothetical protein